jgi:hypothetical protein
LLTAPRKHSAFRLLPSQTDSLLPLYSPPPQTPLGTPTLPHLVGVVGDVVRVVSGGLVLEGLLVNILNVSVLGLDLLHETLELQVYCKVYWSDRVSIDKCSPGTLHRYL